MQTMPVQHCAYTVLNTPELLLYHHGGRFSRLCFRENLCLVAIDEAHCIAEWYGANYLIVFAVVLRIMCDCVNLCPGEVTSKHHSPRLVGYDH